MKKVLKIILGAFLLILALFGIIYSIYNKPLPIGRTGVEADTLAQKMLNAINNGAYQNTRYLEWSFANGGHDYKWDKKRGTVNILWKDYHVLLDTERTEKSIVHKNGLKLAGKSKDELIRKAVAYFNNDSFWLVAPFKIFDGHTQRSLIKMDDGTSGLLVTYLSGGSTPGDSYLWKLDPSGFPISFRMWVSIIPIGGLEATWDDWQLMESGVFLPSKHTLGPMTFDMGEIRGYL